MAEIFVTGMVRSGTTLVERLLDAHPGITLHDQPLPHLFLDAKRRFYESLGQRPPLHLLGPLVGDDRYRPGELGDFLRGHRLDEAALARIVEGMRGYSGCGVPIDELLCAVRGECERRFADALRDVWRRLASDAGLRGHVGAKEVRCEEFLPHLLDEGYHCVVVVRDPRDVVTSMRFGSGRDWVGPARPLLFDLRAWRRSVAFALALRDHPALHRIRYEDLVADPAATLEPVTEALGLAPLEGAELKSRLEAGEGGPWRGNSSHGELHGIDAQSIGRHREHLAADTLAYVETLCLPEMRHLGYACGDDMPRRSSIVEYRDSGALRTDPEVPGDYGARAGETALERARLEAWLDPGWDGADAARLFLFARVARILREEPGPA